MKEQLDFEAMNVITTKCASGMIKVLAENIKDLPFISQYSVALTAFEILIISSFNTFPLNLEQKQEAMDDFCQMLKRHLLESQEKTHE